MKRKLTSALLATALAAGVVAAGLPSIALAQPATAAASAQRAQFEADRAAILAQTGDYRVRFDMRETTAFHAGYTPLEPKLSGGFEIVRVIEDTGTFISLQHILVMEHGGQAMVIKHWRQDWTYEPESVLTYAGPDQWVLSPVAEAERRGAWSQTVWQTDDSPRYGGVGRWSHDDGLVQWTSNETWRPLARRDATRSPVYDRYVGVNRHALTPHGWVHLQDNVKMGVGEGDAGDLVAYVHEDVVNTYRRSAEFSPRAGDDYWAATQGYWRAVREAWDAAIARSGGVRIEEQADWGSVVSERLMGLADQVASGALDEAVASAQAQALIAEATGR